MQSGVSSASSGSSTPAGWQVSHGGADTVASDEPLMSRMSRTAAWTLALILALVLSGCSPTAGGSGQPTSTSGATVPCGDGVSRVELGSPYLGGPTAEFSAKAGTLYITARRFEHGGPFDPAKGSSAIYVGPADRQPTWDQQRNIVSNFTAQVHVEENDFSPVELAAGRYWLWSSNGGDVVVVSCAEGGVSDTKNVTR